MTDLRLLLSEGCNDAGTAEVLLQPGSQVRELVLDRPEERPEPPAELERGVCEHGHKAQRDQRQPDVHDHHGYGDP